MCPSPFSSPSLPFTSSHSHLPTLKIPTPMPPSNPPDPHQNCKYLADQHMELLDVCPVHWNWADEVAEAEAAQPAMMEDNLMDVWLEATKHTSTDGNIVFSSMVVKLVTTLL
ncbi:hypothetical protein CROQUDRAFT_101931 [Cronartium quercuum f. sp. fusiforme G11]|uniref:Uncharacterized protein n=1 Tax=Cronartium quercuum f. sp. fusiforme G11 TaxID=708437 RepID=A0A9P6N7J8_9BASI|nr:hypothetical protein CROQUDRAFT_101931 [Cronartium quercuum f. sp. fusiforme G11]